jgi:hypothetical protein
VTRLPVNLWLSGQGPREKLFINLQPEERYATRMTVESIGLRSNANCLHVVSHKVGPEVSAVAHSGTRIHELITQRTGILSCKQRISHFLPHFPFHFYMKNVNSIFVHSFYRFHDCCQCYHHH